MTKKIAYSILCILATSTGLNAINWNTAGTDGDWSIDANWSGGVVPTGTDEAKINRASNITVTTAVNARNLTSGTSSILSVNSGGSLSLNGANSNPNENNGNNYNSIIGEAGSTSSGTKYGTLELNSGGQITMSGGNFQVGSGSAAGQESFFNITGGTYTSGEGDQLFVGKGGAGTLNLSGGAIALGASSFQPLRIGDNQGNGTLNMTGGTLTTNGIRMNNDRSGGGGTGDANFNLDGGTLTVSAGAAGITLNSNSVIAIGDGVFEWQGNRASNIDALITSGNITFATSTVSTITATAEQTWTDGSTILYADTDEIKSGYTTIWATSAVPEPSAYALLFGSFLFAWVMLRRR
tara:strand:- start:26 stop:1081 length:1056 start_codon:yes stop_codon:yes gene_type:complete